MLAKDKLLHIAMGVGAVVVMLLALKLAVWKTGAALAFVATAFGVFYEVQQWYRKEGQVEVWDAIATASPGWIAWAGLELFKGAV